MPLVLFASLHAVSQPKLTPSMPLVQICTMFLRLMKTLALRRLSGLKFHTPWVSKAQWASLCQAGFSLLLAIRGRRARLRRALLPGQRFYSSPGMGNWYVGWCHHEYKHRLLTCFFSVICHLNKGVALWIFKWQIYSFVKKSLLWWFKTQYGQSREH